MAVACKNEVFKNDGRPLAREYNDNSVFTLQAHSLTNGENGEWYGKKINSLAESTVLVLESPRYLCNLSIAYYFDDGWFGSGDYYSEVEKMSAELSKQFSQSTDGYFAFDNIAIYSVKDKKDFEKSNKIASQCDIHVFESEGTRSNAHVGGFYDDSLAAYEHKYTVVFFEKEIIDKSISTNYRVELSKKNYNGYDISEASPYSKEVLHELGHYILTCQDEYCDGNRNQWDEKGNPHPKECSNYGLMENQYSSIELSNKYKYSDIETGNVNVIPEKLTYQYFLNYGSCWDSIKRNFELVDFGNEAIPPKSQSTNSNSLVKNYKLTIKTPESKADYCERQFASYDTNEIIINKIVVPDFSVSEVTQPSPELLTNVKVITQATGVQAIISATKGTPSSLIQMFYDDTAAVAIPLTPEGSNFTGMIPVQKDRYYLRLISALENNESSYTDFVVRSTKDTLQSSYISDDGSVCISVDSATADSYNFVSQDNFVSRAGYVPLAKAVYIASKDKAAVTDSILLSDVGSSALVDTATIAWYKYENNEWSPLETRKQDGEYSSITAWCSISGDGYYQLMAQPAKTTSTFQPVQGLNITPNNQYDGSVNIAFTDANNKENIRYYKFYYSEQPFNKDTLDSASAQIFNTYDAGYGYTFEDNSKTYYCAIQIVGKDGSVSDLSEIKSFTTGIRDTDNDGIPDSWVGLYSLRTPDKLDEAIAGLDNDADGLTNQQEYQHNTNPQKKDTDNDGVPDSDELTKGLNPLDAMTDGTTPDYVSAYGENDFTVEKVQVNSINGTNTLSISLKNLKNTMAKDVNVKLLFDSNLEWFWQTDFEANKTTNLSYVFDGEVPQSIQVTIDGEQLRYDVDYSNNTKAIGESGDPTESGLVAFLGKDPQGTYYEYNAAELNTAYLAYQIKPGMATAKMYQQFLSSKCQVIALKDKAKGYMDYNAAATASLKAQMKGEAFDINTYFAGSDARVLAETIGVVKIVDKDGNIL